MPPLPSSPPVTGRTQPTIAPKTTASRTATVTRRPGSAASVRRPPSVASSTPKNGTPKVSSQTGAAAGSRLQPAKPRGNSDKENSGGGKVAGDGGSKV
ncbi:hypothetical protein B0A55_13320, partial [Friedmanniomyces simplex]